MNKPHYMCNIMLGCQPDDLPEPLRSELAEWLSKYDAQVGETVKAWRGFAERVNELRYGKQRANLLDNRPSAGQTAPTKET